MSALTEKMSRLEKLLLEAGWVSRRLISYDDEDNYRTARGLYFWERDHLEDSGYGDGGYRVTGSTKMIVVKETGLNVYEGGWIEKGPWQDVAEPALDELIERVEAILAADDKAKVKEKRSEDRAAKKAHADLVARSKAQFGG